MTPRDPATDPAPIVALTAHARAVPAATRTQLAADLRRAVWPRGVVIETCHRVEAYVGHASDAERLGAIVPPPGARRLGGTAAVRHAIAVAVGRDSVVLGEDQVLHQLRAGVDATRAAGEMQPVLERLFATALHAGRRARSWQQGPRPSLAEAAIAVIERGAGPIAGQPILVVGAGRMGRLAATSASASGASVSVASRTSASAAAVAGSVGGRVVDLDPGPGSDLDGLAGVVVALAGPWELATASADALLASGAVVVDLSVPPAVRPALATRLGRRLVTADDLARTALPSVMDTTLVRRLDALIEAATEEFAAWLEGHERRAVAAALADRAEQAREAELAELWRRLPDLDPEARAAIDAMTRHFSRRLLHEPLERLGRDADGRAERAVREAFAL